MASTKEYHDFIMEQFSGCNVTSRAMMGEFVLYCGGKVFGGIYDDRLLVKNIGAARTMMPGAKAELPYPGAREMLLVEEVDDREFLASLADAMYRQLPDGKKKGK